MTEQELKAKNYGLWLYKHICANKPDPETWTEYEGWVTSYGARYDTEEALAAAYARRMKNSQGILVTERSLSRKPVFVCVRTRNSGNPPPKPTALWLNWQNMVS